MFTAGRERHFSKHTVLGIMGLSNSNYDEYIRRKNKWRTNRNEFIKNNRDVMEAIRTIIKKLGYVPGAQIIKGHLSRDHKINISRKKCRKIMKIMKLSANRPKKDPYKGQATHQHPCTAEPNIVDRNFKIGPRRVILTDITYVHYSLERKVCYLAVFKDAYTNEALGYKVSPNMDVKLVKDAYTMMKNNHGGEFPEDVEVYVHSDQGSQYLSTEFKTLLKDDGFIQSMSARGISQDNAPQESFFGRMKTECIDTIMRCPDLDTVIRIIDGYMDTYNTKRYQYGLAGLTPYEFYLYSISGIYPLDNYYGISSDELIPIEDVVKEKLRRNKEKNEKRREKYESRRKEREKLDPLKRMIADQKIIQGRIKKLKSEIKESENQLTFYESLKLRIIRAREFYNGCSREIKERLKTPQEWKNYEELNYIYDMGCIF